MQRDFEFAPEPADGRAPSSTAIARLIPCGEDRSIALPAHTTLEIIEHPQPVGVPGAARHALGLLQWQQGRIALLDVAVLLAQAEPRSTAPRYALVIAMQASPGAPIEHAALALDVLPETVTVTDAEACPLPQGDHWQRVAISCFERAGRPVAVVDTARLLASPAR